MTPPPFDEQACHAAIGGEVAAVYGWPPNNNPRLDPRLVFYFRLVHQAGALLPGGHLMDLGGGLSAFGPVARVLGMKVTIVDDFAGGGGIEQDTVDAARRIIEGWRTRLGIRVVEQDFVAQPLPLETSSVDVVTCFHSLEHWHHSPKRLFREIARVLRPRGVLVIATPNAANLRKRIYALAGKNVYPRLNEWYHDGDPVFRGHVREPVIRDLHQLLVWNDFEVLGTYGRNFIGSASEALAFLPPKIVKALAAGSGSILRFFPTLCSDIHVVGRKRN